MTTSTSGSRLSGGQSNRCHASYRAGLGKGSTVGRGTELRSKSAHAAFTSSLAMASHDGPHLNAERYKVGHQLGRVAADAAGRRRQELLNVDCDSQGCSSGELRSSR